MAQKPIPGPDGQYHGCADCDGGGPPLPMPVLPADAGHSTNLWLFIGLVAFAILLAILGWSHALSDPEPAQAPHHIEPVVPSSPGDLRS